MSTKDAVVQNDILLYLDGHYKPFSYEDALDLFSDLSLILRTHRPKEVCSPVDVAKALRGLILRTTPTVELDPDFQTIRFVREDSIDEIQHKVSEMVALWETELVQTRRLPIPPSRVRLNPDLVKLLAEIA